MREGGEKYLTSFIQLLPPRRIEFNQSATLPCWKSIYSVVYNSYNIESVNMSYDIDSVANLGIAFAWREHMYYNYKPLGVLGRMTKSGLYNLLTIFVKDSVNYQFNNDIQELSDSLQQKRSFLSIMTLMSLLYYVVAFGAPSLVTYAGKKDDNQVCESGINPISHVIYFIFAIASALVELFLFVFITKKIGYLLPNPLQIKESEAKKTPSKLAKVLLQVRRFFQDKKGFFFGIAFVQSQISKYDLYNDVCFVIVCFSCKFTAIGSIGVLILLLNLLVCLKNMFWIIKHMKKHTARKFSTHNLNIFYEVANLLECVAFGDVLDFVSPFNVWVIPNNRLTRYLLPKLAGKSISSKIFKACNKFLFEDTPQLILSLLFVINAQKSAINYNTIIAVISSSLNLLISTYMFLSIRPSTISQLDFNSLISLKKKDYRTKSLQILQLERKQIEDWRNHYLLNKCISLDVIPEETGNLISFPYRKDNENDFKFIVGKNK